MLFFVCLFLFKLRQTGWYIEHHLYTGDCFHGSTYRAVKGVLMWQITAPLTRGVVIVIIKKASLWTIVGDMFGECHGP